MMMDMTTMGSGMLVAMGIYHLAIFVLRCARDCGVDKISAL